MRRRNEEQTHVITSQDWQADSAEMQFVFENMIVGQVENEGTRWKFRKIWKIRIVCLFIYQVFKNKLSPAICERRKGRRLPYRYTIIVNWDAFWCLTQITSCTLYIRYAISRNSKNDFIKCYILDFTNCFARDGESFYTVQNFSDGVGN